MVDLRSEFLYSAFLLTVNLFSSACPLAAEGLEIVLLQGDRCGGLVMFKLQLSHMLKVVIIYSRLYLSRPVEDILKSVSVFFFFVHKITHCVPVVFAAQHS